MEKLKVEEDILGSRLKEDIQHILLYKDETGNSTDYSWNPFSIMDTVDRFRDPRVDGWLLMDSPWGTVGLCLAYLSIIYLGPKFMQDRPAYSLKYPMLVYNLFQTVMCGYMSYVGLHFWLMESSSLMCEPVDYSNSASAMVGLRMSWWYFFSKFIDFFDSFFFILRKKNNQLSTLHIIHHSTMPMTSWLGPKFVGGGNTGFGGTINMVVHVVMYGYYFLAALGVRKEYLWWKKYLTSMQMVQFVAVLVHSTFPLLLQDCDYPKEMCYIIQLNAAMYLYLFYDFYQTEYIKKKKKKE